jgi:hypothetical protein
MHRHPRHNGDNGFAAADFSLQNGPEHLSVVKTKRERGGKYAPIL